MVESPTATMTISTKGADSDDPTAPVEKQPLLDEEQTVTFVHTTPITSRIRRTIRHLHATAGFTARWRGLYPATVYNLATGLSFAFGKEALDSVFPSLACVSEYLVGALVAALWARLHCAWTHAVIAAPSAKRLSQRVPPAAAWRHLALPAVMAELAALSSANLVRILAAAVVASSSSRSQGDASWIVLAGLAVPISALLLAVFCVLPNVIILTRLEAFLLPDDDDTIVPFDRALRASVDGPTLRPRDASRGFGWQAFRIVCKTYVKLFFILVGLVVVAVHVLALEAVLIVGPAAGTLLVAGQEQLKRRGLL